MNKREVVWLIIRLIGIYFLYSAITGSIIGAASFLTALQTPHIAAASVALFLPSFFILAFEGIFGFYLCTNGIALFNILVREGTHSDS